MNSTIVIGGSMAGMLAARVLSETFDRVTILERDVISGDLEGRPGVPQARHLHALLPRGRRILEHWFPGITSEFQTAGAEILDVANESHGSRRKVGACDSTRNLKRCRRRATCWIGSCEGG